MCLCAYHCTGEWQQVHRAIKFDHRPLQAGAAALGVPCRPRGPKTGAYASSRDEDVSPSAPVNDDAVESRLPRSDAPCVPPRMVWRPCTNPWSCETN
eukprot:1132055-Prorocentrum_minimum.AAC.1